MHEIFCDIWSDKMVNLYEPLYDRDLVEHIADDDDIEIVEFIEFGLPRRINVRLQCFDTLDATTFRKRFRLTKECVLHLLIDIEEYLEYPTDSNNCVSPINQLLTCLRFYSTGGHLDLVADWAGMHVSTVSRIIWRVSQAIASKYNDYICFPNSDDQIKKTHQDFFDIAAFPRVIGAIDCTHCKIQSSGGDEAEIFRNRKSYFSINVQMICNAKLKIMNVVSRWPGSVHDATIYNNSTICQSFENNRYPNCILLGDSGYPNKNYLLTPLLNPNEGPEQLYNESHIRTRNTIERCFGVLKRRFPILAYGCRLKMHRFLTIIVACAILHNIALNMGDLEAPLTPDELNEHVLNELIANGQIPSIQEVEMNDHLNPGVISRNMFITQYFSTL